MAFLQRVLNGGGAMDGADGDSHEYAAGRGRMDLFVEYGRGTYIIAIKLARERQSPERVMAKDLPWEDRPGWSQEGTVTALRM
jgi:hypothetical protein